MDYPLGNGESMKEYKVFFPFIRQKYGGENQKFQVKFRFSFSPILVFDNKNYVCQINFRKGSIIFPGDTVEAIMRTINCPLEIGDKFILSELKEIA